MLVLFASCMPLMSAKMQRSGLKVPFLGESSLLVCRGETYVPFVSCTLIMIELCSVRSAIIEVPPVPRMVALSSR